MENRAEYITPKKPSPERGAEYVEVFIREIKALKEIKKKNNLQMMFRKIFRRDPDRLATKYSFENFAGFFLNLDLQNQMDLLHYVYRDDLSVDLELPEISNWEELGRSIFGNPANGITKISGGEEVFEFTLDDVRSFAVGFKRLTKWEAYPEVKVWIYNFLLYANNNSIQDPSYTGNRYGNYANWAEYYLTLDKESRVELMIRLIPYS